MNKCTLPPLWHFCLLQYFFAAVSQLLHFRKCPSFWFAASYQHLTTPSMQTCVYFGFQGPMGIILTWMRKRMENCVDMKQTSATLPNTPIYRKGKWSYMMSLMRSPYKVLSMCMIIRSKLLSRTNNASRNITVVKEWVRRKFTTKFRQIVSS